VARRTSGLSREELCSNSKRRGTVAAKEAVIVLGRRGGIRGRELAAGLGLDPSTVTRRLEAARSRGKENAEAATLGKALGERPR
jgi:DNA-binding MarR family transcriptional regulator